MNTVAATPAPHFSTPLTIPHDPLLEVRVKPVPLSAAVKVAHVPEVYQVPLLMMQPVCMPLAMVTPRKPLPENGAPGPPVGPGTEELVLDDVVVVVVGGVVGWEVDGDVEVVGAGAPDFGL